ncbi:MAG: potassium/proton antiporter [Muribaculaceae bacterium]|nr:potassium/proton antiporter [Muribaculaceae bacterium]
MDIITSENILAVGSVLLIAGVIAGKMSYRVGLPLLLVFLLVGMGFGCDGLGIHFNDMHTAQFVGMIALCIILFSGGLSMRYKAIRPVIVPGLVLSTVGVCLTALFTGLFIWWLSGMAWTNIHFALLPSLLLAATMSSTDSASVFGILGSRHVGLRHNLRPMLELESGSNDPMAYMLTIVLITSLTPGGEVSAGGILVQLLLQFGVGAAMGFAMGYGARWLSRAYMNMCRRQGGEDSSQSTAMLTILILGSVFLTFSLATDLHGNGYLAVYILGIYLGNTELPNKRGIVKFVDGFTWLSQIVVFLMLGLLVNPAEMVDVAPVSLLIGMFMIVAGRPLSVMLSLLPFKGIGGRSRLFVSWVGLRGAVPIIFATYPVIADVEGAGQIFNIVFFVTLLSLLVQGTTVIYSARKLGLTEAEGDGGVDDFGVDLADNLPTTLHTLTLTPGMLERGNTLKDIQLPAGTLVMMVRRGDSYIVPNGTRKLHPGDRLLLIKEQ